MSELRHDITGNIGRAGLVVCLFAAVLIGASLSSACSDDDPTGSATPTDPASSTTPVPSGLPLPAEFTNSAGRAVTLAIEVADTPDERSIGLMNRESLPTDAGMLFDFQADVQAGFWMKNTLIPLSIAFIDKDGVIVHIEDMEPQTEDLHYSPSVYRYAIEVNQGWYADNDIAVGDTVTLRNE